MAACLLPLLLLFADPQALATELAYLGRDAFLGGEWRAAAEYLDLASRLVPGRVDLHAARDLANAAANWAELPPCQNRYISPIKLPEGKDAASWLKRAQRLYEVGRFDEAMVAVEQALALDSESALAWTLRAELYFSRGDLADALVTAQVAERKDSAAIKPYFIQMRVHLLKRERETYEAVGKRLNAIATENDQYYLEMAKLELLSGNEERAATSISRVLQQDPKSVPALVMQADTRRRAGNIRGAIADLELSLDRDPECATTWQELAALHSRMADLRSALHCIDEAIRLSPAFWACYCFRGNCHSSMRNWKAAAADYSRVLALAPRSSQERFLRAYTLYRNTANQIALSEIDRLLRQQPVRAEFHSLRARCLAGMGRLPEATDAMRRSVELKKASTGPAHAFQPPG